MAELKNASSSHITIACKIALGWIDLQICEPREVMQNTQTGPRPVTEWARVGKVVRIRGTAYPRGEAPEGFPSRPEMIMGYALTRDVPRAFWEVWIEQNKRTAFVESGMIFAFEHNSDIASRGKDYEGKMSGLEPVARDKNGLNDARIPKPINASVGALEPGVR